MNKLGIAMLLDSAISLEKNIEEVKEHPYWKDIKKFIIQELNNQPTTLDSDVEEALETLYILSRLKDELRVDYSDEDIEKLHNTLKQALETDYRKAWEHHYNLVKELQSTLDKVRLIVLNRKYAKGLQDSEFQELCKLLKEEIK